VPKGVEMALSYRADVDGLRAVAVLPVVAYHMLLMPGGFVGVDVFFVISGYLISGIIFGELKDGSFSLVRFYERRVRRILPALYAVLAVTLVLALLFTAPSDTVEIAKSALAATLSLSNVYFWQSSGYFETAATTAPLLHTWSLSVEEQFYLIFPALFLAWHKIRGGRFVEMLLPIFALSLGISIYGALNRDTAAFYLLHSRAWELMLGAILALDLVKPIGRRWIREIVALAGAAAIAVPVFFYNDRIAFPGVAALAPCLGAAVIIWTGQQPTFVRWGLSLRPVVAVGLISYSLYLWHWPVIVMQKMHWLFYTGDSRLIEKGLLLTLCFGLAVASWWLVERPFRKRIVFADRRSLFIAAGAVGAALGAACIALIVTGGLPRFLPERDAGYSAWLTYEPALSTREGSCLIEEEGELAPVCLTLSADRPNVLILGDSHAAHLWAGLTSTHSEVNFLQATASSCPPTQEAMESFYPACRQVLSQAQALIRGGRIDKVILAGNWFRFGSAGGLAYAATLRASGTDVVLFGPAPYYTRPLPRLLELGRRRSDPDTPAAFMESGLFELDADMAERAGAEGTPYVSQLELLCAQRTCQTMVDGEPIQFDSNHYTATGSAELVERAGLVLP
jgi:peptidoglycan/LPS O-acetylase OafA/YrhL